MKEDGGRKEDEGKEGYDGAHTESILSITERVY
jgi:hypothetical protein